MQFNLLFSLWTQTSFGLDWTLVIITDEGVKRFSKETLFTVFGIHSFPLLCFPPSHSTMAVLVDTNCVCWWSRQLFIHSSVHSFVRSFIRSFVCSFRFIFVSSASSKLPNQGLIHHSFIFLYIYGKMFGQQKWQWIS